jgi:hypothetical protein
MPIDVVSETCDYVRGMRLSDENGRVFEKETPLEKAKVKEDSV